MSDKMNRSRGTDASRKMRKDSGNTKIPQTLEEGKGREGRS